LDPDNEAINDAYAKMVEILNDNESVDMVVGNIIRSASDIRRIDYAKHIYNISDDGVADNTYELLKSTNLKVQSIQALVVKRDIIIKNNLKMVEGAAGQDTLFFQELL